MKNNKLFLLVIGLIVFANFTIAANNIQKENLPNQLLGGVTIDCDTNPDLVCAKVTETAPDGSSTSYEVYGENPTVKMEPAKLEK